MLSLLYLIGITEQIYQFILVLSLNKLIELTLKYKEFSFFYIKALENAYLKAEELLLDISTLTSTERYITLKKRIPDIDKLITQRHIASYLNISPVQLSRIKKN